MFKKLKRALLISRQNQICRGVLISHKYRFTLDTTAKCGSGTAKEWFLFEHNVLFDQHIKTGTVDNYLGMSIHDYLRNPNNLYCATEKDLLKATSSYSKIIVVRNPWKRLVSFYCDKILNSKNWLPALNTFTQENYSKDITFREFVRYIEQIPDNALEPHLRPQNYARQNKNFDFVVKLENFGEEIAQVTKVLQLPNPLVNIHRNRILYDENLRAANAFDLKPQEIICIPSYQSFYDQELYGIVRTKYRQDIERFNYGFVD